MGYIAKWGPKAFVLSPDKVIPFIDLSTAVTLKSDSDTDAGGGVVSNAKSIDPQEIEFATTYLRAAGVDPRQEYEEWAALVGDTYTLYIGGKRFGPDKMTLGSISLSDVLLSPNGDFLKATVAIILTQAEEPPKATPYVSGTNVSSTNVSDSVSADGSTNNNGLPFYFDTEEYYKTHRLDRFEIEAALVPTYNEYWDNDPYVSDDPHLSIYAPIPGGGNIWLIEEK